MSITSAWIKICGVTCAEDLEILIEAGVNAVGINLWPKSPRSVSTAQALELTKLAKGRIESVWVTVDMALEPLLELITQGQPDWVQLHGEQPVEYADAIGSRAFYAVGLKSSAHVEQALHTKGAMVLIDARDDVKKGGTGKLAPLELARTVCGQRDTVLAGGLNPENVSQRIASVMPAGVDTASGVEASPGRKDPVKVRHFCEQARKAFADVLVRVNDV